MSPQLMLPSTRRPGVALTLLVAVLVTVSLMGPAADASPAAAATAGCDDPSWVVAWMMPASGTGTVAADRTLRVMMPLHLGGEQVRVRLSNELGTAPVTFSDVHVGKAGAGASVIPGTNVAVTFGGASTVTIPPGTTAVSDGAPLQVDTFDRVAVSFYAPVAAPSGPGHSSPFATTYTATGNHAAQDASTGYGSGSSGSRFLNAVDVFTPNDGAIVAFGDSITEGASLREILEGDHPAYTATLARRLDDLARSGGPRLSVVNSGISGNRLLRPNTGPSGLDRLDRDALDHSGVAGVVVMEGINDLSPYWPQRGETELPTLAQMAAGYREVVDRAAARGIRVWLSPLTPAGDLVRTTPFMASTTPDQVRLRREINTWIRAQPDAYDGRIDFDPVVADPFFPNWLTAEFDSGDNLHPNAAGLAAMADSIDLGAFSALACR